MHLELFICAFFAATSTCIELPNTLKKCNRNQNDFEKCLTTAVEDAIRKSGAGIKEIGIPDLEPLKIPSLVIEAGSGAVGFQQNYQNLKVSGFTKISCSKVAMDFEGKLLKLECILDHVKFEFVYEINGKILLLPIVGKGPGTITLDQVNVDLTFNLEEYEKKGRKHFKVAQNKLLLSPHPIRFHLENLFDGDKALGDNINKVFNDNWPEIFKDVKPSYEDAFGQIFASIFDNVLRKVSVVELFGEE